MSNESFSVEPAGSVFVVSAPSGAGKTSLVKALVESMPGLSVSVSHTTRPMRPGEVDGKDYYFIQEAEFQKLLSAGAFIEHAQVFGNSYGTSRAGIEDQIGRGFDVILEIDWQGARLVRNAFDCQSIFVLPPSRHALQERLRNRGQDSAGVIAQRTAEAVGEIRHYDEFDYLVVNDVFEKALAQLKCIVTAARLRRRPQVAWQAALVRELVA